MVLGVGFQQMRSAENHNSRLTVDGTSRKLLNSSRWVSQLKKAKVRNYGRSFSVFVLIEKRNKIQVSG